MATCYKIHSWLAKHQAIFLQWKAQLLYEDSLSYFSPLPEFVSVSASPLDNACGQLVRVCSLYRKRGSNDAKVHVRVPCCHPASPCYPHWRLTPHTEPITQFLQPRKPVYHLPDKAFYLELWLLLNNMNNMIPKYLCICENDTKSIFLTLNELCPQRSVDNHLADGFS